MNINLSSIKDARVRTFYALTWPQHQILQDFYACLSEEHFDFRMVDTSERRSDSPRESLAHILYVQLVYVNGLKAGKLEYKSMGTEQYKDLTKAELLSEWERIDADTFSFLTSDAYDSNQKVEVFWGGAMNGIDVLFFQRDHEILHIGWNLALMDHLNIPRYNSLIQYWGP